MSIGASQLPTPSEPPEIHDIGIVSNSDDQETVNAAVGLEPEAKPKTPPAEEPPPAEAGEVTPPVEAPPETPPAEEPPPVEAAGEETPPVEEPPAESAAVQKRFNSFAATVANRDQHIKILTQRLDAMERRQAPQSRRSRPSPSPPRSRSRASRRIRRHTRTRRTSSTSTSAPMRSTTIGSRPTWRSAGMMTPGPPMTPPPPTRKPSSRRTPPG